MANAGTNAGSGSGASGGVPDRDRLQELVETYGGGTERPSAPVGIIELLSGVTNRVSNFAAQWGHDLSDDVRRRGMPHIQKYLGDLEERARDTLSGGIGRVRDATYTIGQEAIGAAYLMVASGTQKAGGLQQSTVQYIIELDEQLQQTVNTIASVSPNRAVAVREANRLGRELGKVREALADYQAQISAAVAAGNRDEVSGLVLKVGQVVDINHGIVDGQYVPKGAAKEARARLLDSDALHSIRVQLAFATSTYGLITSTARQMYNAQAHLEGLLGAGAAREAR